MPMPCFLYRFWVGRHEKGPEIGVRGPTGDQRTETESSKLLRKVMRRCLQQRRTLGYCNNLSSRLFVTASTQASWRHAVKQKNASVNALVHVVPKDEAGPVSEGPLNGMTVAVKDNICTKNMPTTCSSAMLRGNVRSPRSSQSRTRDTNSAIHTHARHDQTFNHLSTRQS